MASLVPTFFLLAAALSSLTFAYAANNNNNNSCPNYEYIFQVGDSLADTGNRFRISNVKSSYRADHFPYGEKFFGKPTGRFSNKIILLCLLSFPFSTLTWSKKLILAMDQDHSKGIRQVIRYGAKRIVVPGNFPLGCFPYYLTMFSSLDYEDYDEFGCLKAYNELAMYHNDYLERALSILKLEYSNVAIKYIDYYSAVKSILERPSYFGFNKKSILKACCGIGGQYNYDDDILVEHLKFKLVLILQNICTGMVYILQKKHIIMSQSASSMASHLKNFNVCSRF
uniref:Acetylajmalan esterase-like n=1 Tax=Nicotiana tabacum TaxID=4097 RepID=A0A1S4A124_TOBAC|nr:PREDICTED: acetylajmalan esterase-like [Nicotiana tabacum]